MALPIKTPDVNIDMLNIGPVINPNSASEILKKKLVLKKKKFFFIRLNHEVNLLKQQKWNLYEIFLINQRKIK